MWVFIPKGQALKVDGGDALAWIVPMDQVAILPTVATPPPVTASPTPPIAAPAAVRQTDPTLVQAGSPVTIQLLPSP